MESQEKDFRNPQKINYKKALKKNLMEIKRIKTIFKAGYLSNLKKMLQVD